MHGVSVHGRAWGQAQESSCSPMAPPGIAWHPAQCRILSSPGRKEPLLAAQKHAAEAAAAAATPRPSALHPAPGLPTVPEAAALAGEAALDLAAANAWAVGGTCDPKYWECPGELQRIGMD